MKKFLPLLFSFTCLACNDQSNTTEKDNVIKLQEQKIKELEDRLNEVEKNQKNDVTPEKADIDYSPKHTPQTQDFFYIGSTEEEVLKVQGQPTSILGGGSRKTYMYGRDNITFDNGKVTSYMNLDGSLKIKVKSVSNSSSVNKNNALPVKPKLTKYVYYTCYIKEFGEMTKYISKIYTIEDYTDEKMFKIGDCLTEQIRFFKQTRDKITMLPDWFDSYSAASIKWNNASGGQMPGQEFCNR